MTVFISKNAELFFKALEDIWMAELSWYGSPNNSAWHCIQAAEKLLKGFLRCLKQEYDYGHELMPLLYALTTSNKVSVEFEEYVMYLSDFSSSLRYKSMSSDPSPEEARVAIARTKYLLQELRNYDMASAYINEASEVHLKLLKSSSDKYSNVDISKDET